MEQEYKDVTELKNLVEQIEEIWEETYNDQSEEMAAAEIDLIVKLIEINQEEYEIYLKTLEDRFNNIENLNKTEQKLILQLQELTDIAHSIRYR